ncbi:MAG: helix-turn-helix transcriptional regulator [Planctomycetota bacterium]
MPRKTKTRTTKTTARQRASAKPEVLARFTDEQLEAMEKKASRDLPAAEQRELSASAEEAFRQVETVEQVLRALKAARRRRGISQEELDRRSGLGRANISRLENLHLENPTLTTVLRYASAAGLTLTFVDANQVA